MVVECYDAFWGSGEVIRGCSHPPSTCTDGLEHGKHHSSTFGRRRAHLQFHPVDAPGGCRGKVTPAVSPFPPRGKIGGDRTSDACKVVCWPPGPLPCPIVHARPSGLGFAPLHLSFDFVTPPSRPADTESRSCLARNTEPRTHASNPCMGAGGRDRACGTDKTRETDTWHSPRK